MDPPIRLVEGLVLVIVTQLIFLSLPVSVLPLKIIMLDVPSPVASGESVELVCSFDLEGDGLYSVKYYKNGHEFFRFVPKEFPPAQTFSMPGIKVDISRSDRSKVYLKNVDLDSSGLYRCEVSADAPSFNTDAHEKEMQIYVLPTSRPELTTFGVRKAREGDVLTASCTSSKSKPSAVINWFVNDAQVSRELIKDPIITGHPDGLESSSSKVRFTILKEHFKNGLLRLKCSSTVLDMNSHESIIDITDKDVVESLSPKNSKTSTKKRRKNQQQNRSQANSTSDLFSTHNMSQVHSGSRMEELFGLLMTFSVSVSCIFMTA